MTTLNLSEIIERTAREMLEKLGLEANVKLIKNENENENEIEVVVETQDPGILIGYHGETLNSFQHLLNLILYKETDQWLSLVVDTADYRKNRERVLRSMAESAVHRVKTLSKPFVLPFLSSYERRIVHLILANEEGVISESEGEGRERRVVVKLKKE